MVLIVWCYMHMSLRTQKATLLNARDLLNETDVLPHVFTDQRRDIKKDNCSLSLFGTESTLIRQDLLKGGGSWNMYETGWSNYRYI